MQRTPDAVAVVYDEQQLCYQPVGPTQQPTGAASAWRGIGPNKEWDCVCSARWRWW